MKEHFCPAEQSMIAFDKECNWCGEKESLAQTQEPDDIASILACRNMLDAQPVSEVDRVIWPERTEQEPWCMKMNGCKTKCEDCPDEPPQRTEQLKACIYCGQLVAKEIT